MNEGSHISTMFERLPAFDRTLLDGLAERIGPSPLVNRASLLRLALVGAQRNCYYPLPTSMTVETALDRIVKVETLQPGTNVHCLEEAAKSFPLPKTYFTEDRAHWLIEL